MLLLHNMQLSDLSKGIVITDDEYHIPTLTIT